jgi:starch-binding outer membrane protein, SusD/RagB family
MKKLLIIITGCILFAGCSLKEEPKGFLSTENFYKTKEDAESAVMFMYSAVPSYRNYSTSYYMVMHSATEEFAFKAGVATYQVDLDNNAQDGRANYETGTVFALNYIVVARANAVIENVPRITMDTAYRNHMLGEAYFMRAFAHYNLVRLFGSVPLRMHTLSNVSQVGEPRSSIENIYESCILPDLQKAAVLMDNSKRRARVNKTGAQGLLANVYLFLASASKSGLAGYEFANGTDYYALAKTEAAKVVRPATANGYNFDDSYLNIFNPENESSGELIFYTLSSRSTVGPTNLSSTYGTPYCGSQSFKVGSEYGGFTNSFGWEHLVVETPFYNSFATDDKRKKAFFCTSVTVDGVEYSYNPLNPSGFIRSPFPTKYLDSDNDGDVGNRYAIVRYSEVLLTYAEACGLTPEGIEALNQIRRRAGLGEYTLGSFSGNDAFRDAVLQERTWELCYEFHHLFDLRRTKKMEQVLQQQYGKSLIKNYYFFEVPVEEKYYNPEF